MKPIFPGAVFVGMVSNPGVNHGQPLPVYENAPRTDGKPSINTPEGWHVLGNLQPDGIGMANDGEKRG